MTDPAQSEVIALRATVRALREALEKTRDECDRYMNQDEAIVGIANIFHIAHAALELAKEK